MFVQVEKKLITKWKKYVKLIFLSQKLLVCHLMYSMLGIKMKTIHFQCSATHIWISYLFLNTPIKMFFVNNFWNYIPYTSSARLNKFWKIISGSASLYTDCISLDNNKWKFNEPKNHRPRSQFKQMLCEHVNVRFAYNDIKNSHYKIDK